MPARWCIVTALLATGCAPAGGRRDSLPVARPNDNVRPAGTRVGDTLTLHLVAQRAEWRPAGDSAPGIQIAAFAEEGGGTYEPGPLIRAPLGTRIRLSMRNALADTLVFCTPFANQCDAGDTLRILPGATQTREFVADRVGTFQYGAFALYGGKLSLLVQRHQLAGAMVIDSAGRAPGNDRIFVITSWTKTDASSSPFVQGINGRTWPNTERFDVAVGDTLRWRWLNVTDTPHPMHLHGFYFRLLARGDGQRDTAFARDRQTLEVTEDVLGSATIEWAPTRPGNWLFHCHKAAHMSANQQLFLAGIEPPDSMPPHTAADHPTHGMGGLILGVRARLAASATPTTNDKPAPVRTRLVIHERPRFYAHGEKALGFVLEPAGADVAADSLTVPGPMLSFTRGVPAEITIVNRLGTPTTVHWHGIELESYYDGVAGWSGIPGSLAPFIAPSDSFVARFTPPRSGTFMYHAHVAEERQLTSGLFGPIVVHEPGVSWNARQDHILMFSQAGTSDSALVVVNGSSSVDTVFLARGKPNRLRLINLTGNDEIKGVVEDSRGQVFWRAVAKDGADLPLPLRALRPAKFLFGPGEIMDVVMDAPRNAATIHIESFNNFDIVLMPR